MSKSEWKKKCPNCGGWQYYRDKYGLKYATEKNTICRSCSLIGHKVTDETKDKLRKTWLGKKLSDDHKKAISDGANPYVRTKKHREVLRKR